MERERERDPGVDEVYRELCVFYKEWTDANQRRYDEQGAWARRVSAIRTRCFPIVEKWIQQGEPLPAFFREQYTRAKLAAK